MTARVRHNPHEPVTTFHSAPGRHGAPDGGDHAGRPRRAAASCRSPRCPQVDYPTIQVPDLLSGRQPDVMTSTVTAPLEKQFGQMASLNQMTSTEFGGGVGDHAPVQPATCRSTSPSRKCRPRSTRRATCCRRPARAADLREGRTPPTRRSSRSRSPRRRCRSTQVPGSRRHAPRAEDLAGGGRRPRVGGAAANRLAVRIQANTRALAVVRPQHRRPAHHHLEPERQYARKAASTARARALHDQRERPADRARRRIRASVIAYRNGAPVHADGRRDDRRRRRRTPSSRAWVESSRPAMILNVQRQPGANVDSRRSTASRSAAAAACSATLPAALDVAHGNRSHDHDPRVRARRAVRTGALGRAGRAS